MRGSPLLLFACSATVLSTLCFRCVTMCFFCCKTAYFLLFQSWFRIYGFTHLCSQSLDLSAFVALEQCRYTGAFFRSKLRSALCTEHDHLRLKMHASLLSDPYALHTLTNNRLKAFVACLGKHESDYSTAPRMTMMTVFETRAQTMKISDLSHGCTKKKVRQKARAISPFLRLTRLLPACPPQSSWQHSQPHPG